MEMLDLLWVRGPYDNVIICDCRFNHRFGFHLNSHFYCSHYFDNPDEKYTKDQLNSKMITFNSYFFERISNLQY